MDKKRLTIFLIFLISGLLIALTSAVLLFLGNISSSISSIFGIIGIGLIGMSGVYFAATSKK